MRTPQSLVVASLVAFNMLSTRTTAAAIVGAFQVNAGVGYLTSGSGFRPVTATTEVAAGDSLMVAPGGSAEIVYDEYCRMPVEPGRVAVVAPVSPCARGADLGLPVKAPPAASPDNTGYYLLGGAAAVGLGVGIWALTKSSSSSPAPASP